MALTANNQPARRTGDLTSIPAAAGSVVFAGSIVVQIGGVGSAGKAGTGTTIGISRGYVDNSAGADGDLVIQCARGIYLLKGTGFTLANLGADCYVLDDETVTLTETGNVLAGKVFDVDDTGVWVDMR